jgi:hypothetical protein
MSREATCQRARAGASDAAVAIRVDTPRYRPALESYAEELEAR